MTKLMVSKKDIVKKSGISSSLASRQALLKGDLYGIVISRFHCGTPIARC